MATLFVILFLVFVLLCIGGPIVLLQIRKVLREQKNYERGLKMVPLLISLPPPSDDIDGNNRDFRDIVEENISRAQTLYSIIASTIIPKGFKVKIYGQRHFAFEIVGSKGLIDFYAAVPVALVDVVEQAIVSAYPLAKLEEVAEQNVFSPIGKISGTIGGELTLKEPFAYPIATYQEIKRDAIQSVLNALSGLDKEDGAGIQILIRPANNSWRKIAAGVAAEKRRGKSSKADGSPMQLLSNLMGKPAEKSAAEPKEKPISGLDQTIADAIDDKMRYPGFEVLIRVVASSNISQRAQKVLTSIVSSFALFDAPGKNGFKYTVAKDMERFVTAYILRFFPATSNKTILNSVELATLFHFPDRGNIPTSQLQRQDSKQVDGPRNMPETGLLLGYNLFRGVKKAIRLEKIDRRLHIYAVGQTGTGKSTFLENLALQDMMNGHGFAFVDPHGDVVERLISMVPKERTEDVIYFNPADMASPLGLNMFEFDNPDQKDFLIQEAIGMLYKLYDPQHQGIMGPRYEHLFRMAALTVMADPAGGTFIDIPKLFRDPNFVKQKMQYLTDKNVIEFWTKEVPQSQRSNEYGEVTSWFVSKFGAFLSNEMMRNIIGQTKSAFTLRDLMDEGKILLVNLSKGLTGELNSKLLGMIFVMKVQAAAMSRADILEDDRRDFCLYVDEFQNFSTDSFSTIMSEARKYRLNLIVANQFTTQLSEEVRDAVFGNIGTTVSFRIGQNDVDALSQYFQPLFDGDDLLRIPNHNAVVRTLVKGVPTQPFSMATLPPFGVPNPQLGAALKQLSAAKYGHPRAEVEKAIFDRLETKEPPRPTFGTNPGTPSFGSVPSPSAARPPAAASGSSFLDEWLSKRQSPASSQQRPPVPPPAPTGSPSNLSSSNPFLSPPPSSNIPSSFNLPQASSSSSSEPTQSANPFYVPKSNIVPDAKIVNPDNELKIIQDSPMPSNQSTLYIDSSGNFDNQSSDKSG
jgi:hypothetical protein